MRVAIVSAIELTSGEGGMPRGFARIAGRSILQRHVEFALESGCGQIVCLASNLTPELIDLQHFIEKSGARFQAIRDIKPLSGIVKASDEVLALADGLAFPPDVAREALENGKRILVFPADQAVGLGFERIDRERAWAGVAMVSGGLVERLSNLPSDIDVQSSLMRLALQTGTQAVDISGLSVVGEQWVVVNGDEPRAQFETRWLDQNSKPTTWISPVRAMVDRAATAILRRHPHPAKLINALGCLSATLLLVAAGCSVMVFPLAGLVSLAGASIVQRFGITFAKLYRGEQVQSQGGRWWAAFQSLSLDLLLIVLTVISVPSRHRAGAAFAAFVAMGLIHLIEIQGDKIFRPKLRELLSDRTLLALLLVAGLTLGNITVILQLFASLLMVVMLTTFYGPKLTRA
ncbi:MAG: hypothetical protein WAT93_03850 [Pontixanthobacter sp.]